MFNITRYPDTTMPILEYRRRLANELNITLEMARLITEALGAINEDAAIHHENVPVPFLGYVKFTERTREYISRKGEVIPPDGKFRLVFVRSHHVQKILRGTYDKVQ